MNTFLYFHYGNRMLYFLFFLIQSKSANIENRVQIRPLLYSSQPISLQIFFVLVIIHITTRTGLIYETLTKLCCEYVNAQEMIKHKKTTNMCLKLILQVIILKRKIYKVVSSLNNSTEFLFRKSTSRFKFKFSRFYFQVRFRGMTNKKLSEPRKLISNICSTVCNFQSMKSPVELDSLFSKLFCYITSFVISRDQTQDWMTCKLGLYVKYYCFE